jgi:hypothetical protein
VRVEARPQTVFDSHGDMGASARGPQGLFDHDTRYLSRLELLNGMHDAKPPDLLRTLADCQKARSSSVYDRCRRSMSGRCRHHRVSRFQLPRSVTAPTRNCLDFGWREAAA